MRYRRTPSASFSEERSRPSFLRTCPARKPRTEWDCHPAASVIISMVAPSDFDRSASRLAVFVADKAGFKLRESARFRSFEDRDLEDFEVTLALVIAVLSCVEHWTF